MKISKAGMRRSVMKKKTGAKGSRGPGLRQRAWASKRAKNARKKDRA